MRVFACVGYYLDTCYDLNTVGQVSSATTHVTILPHISPGLLTSTVQTVFVTIY